MRLSPCNPNILRLQKPRPKRPHRYRGRSENRSPSRGTRPSRRPLRLREKVVQKVAAKFGRRAAVVAVEAVAVVLVPRLVMLLCIRQLPWLLLRSRRPPCRWATFLPLTRSRVRAWWCWR